MYGPVRSTTGSVQSLLQTGIYAQDALSPEEEAEVVLLKGVFRKVLDAKVEEAYLSQRCPYSCNCSTGNVKELRDHRCEVSSGGRSVYESSGQVFLPSQAGEGNLQSKGNGVCSNRCGYQPVNKSKSQLIEHIFDKHTPITDANWDELVDAARMVDGKTMTLGRLVDIFIMRSLDLD